MCLNHKASLQLKPDSITWWHTPRRRRPFALDRSPLSSQEVLLEGAIHGQLTPTTPEYQNLALSLGKRWNPWWYSRFGFEPHTGIKSQWNAETGLVHPRWLQEFALGIHGHTSMYARLLQNLNISPFIAQMQIVQHLHYTQLKTNSTWSSGASAAIQYSHSLWSTGLMVYVQSGHPYKSVSIYPSASISLFPHPLWNFHLQFKAQTHPQLWKQFQLKLRFQRHFVSQRTSRIQSPSQTHRKSPLKYLSARPEKKASIHPDFSAPDSTPNSIITLSQLETILNQISPQICQKASTTPQSPLNQLLWQNPFWLTDPSDNLHSFRYFSGSPHLNHQRGCQHPLNLIGENTNPQSDTLQIRKIRQLPTFFSNTP